MHDEGMHLTNRAPEITGVSDAHHAVAQALREKDESTLERLVSDRCRIIGPKGFSISKQEWIRPHVDDVYELVTLEVIESSTEEFGSTAVVVDLHQSVCIFKGERIEGLFRVTSVWHHDEAWQLVALQYTAVSEQARPD